MYNFSEELFRYSCLCLPKHGSCKKEDIYYICQTILGCSRTRGRCTSDLSVCFL